MIRANRSYRTAISVIICLAGGSDISPASVRASSALANHSDAVWGKFILEELLTERWKGNRIIMSDEKMIGNGAWFGSRRETPSLGIYLRNAFGAASIVCEAL